MRIDYSGNVTIANDLTVSGNFSVLGTTTTLNTATLQVEDKNITLNYGTGDTSGSANGAGITIQDAVNGSTDATILWDASSDRFEFSNGVDVENGGAVRVYRSGNSAYGELRFDTGENLDLFSSWGNKYLRLTRDGHLQLSGTTRIAHNGDATLGQTTISGNSIQVFPTSAGAASVQLQRQGQSTAWALAQGHTATDMFEILRGSSSYFSVNSSGNATFAGAISSTGAVTGTSFTTTGTRVVNVANSTLTMKGDTGGWAFGLHALGSSNTNHGGFGFLGGADSLSYYYIGESYDDATNFRFYKSGQLNIGTTTVLDSSRNLTNIGGVTASGMGTFRAGAGGIGLQLKSNSSWSSGTLYAPAIRWQEADGTNIGGIRGFVNSSGDNYLALGTGWLDQELLIHSSGITVAGGGAFGADTTITGGRLTITDDTNALRLRSTNNGAGVNINFGDHVGTYAQSGDITYVHQDSVSYGSGNAFILSSTEATLTVLADGKLMFKEGLYVKPSSGTGAGTQVIDSSRNLVNIAAISASGEFKSTSASSNAVKTRFLSGAASGSTSDGPLFINYGKNQDVGSTKKQAAILKSEFMVMTTAPKDTVI